MEKAELYEAIGRKVVQIARHAEIVSFADKAKKGAGKKSQNCTAGKSHSCTRPDGSSYCISLNRKCRAPATGTAKQVADYTAEKVKTAKAPKKAAKVTKSKEVEAATFSEPKFRQDELDYRRKRIIDRLGPGGEKRVAEAERNFQKIVDDADIHIRVGSVKTLESIVSGGFKNSVETGTGVSIQMGVDKARLFVEESQFGIPVNASAKDRPIYGYMARKGFDADGEDANGISGYGDISVRLKSDVKKRATVTRDDTIGSSTIDYDYDKSPPIEKGADASYQASKLTSVNIASHVWAPGWATSLREDPGDQIDKLAKAKTIKDILKSNEKGVASDPYMEAQVHGGVKSTDIAGLTFRNGQKPSQAIKDWAKANNVEIEVL